MGIHSLALGFSSGFGSAFLAFILERFASFSTIVWKQISIIWNVEDELRQLQRTFLKIQDLVNHSSSDPLMFCNRSNAWLLWFEETRKLAYDADSLLDHVSMELSSYCAKNPATFNQEEQQVQPMILGNFSKFDLAHKISEMNGKLHELAIEIEHLIMFEKANSKRWSDYRRLHSSASSCVAGRTIVGRAKDIQSITDFLGKTCVTSNFSVIGIMGMSGIGKTALASHVFYDVGTNFDLRLWVSVSVDFDVIRITRSIVEYATLCACTLSDLGSIQQMLQNTLRDKKFLLVLDDYWSEKGDDWDTLSWPFRCGSQGSKIIVTTCSTRVPSVICCAETFKLDVLSDDECCEIIMKSSATCVESLESLGQQISKKCKGIPLVATTLGNELRSRSTEEEWQHVLENELWDIIEDDSILLRVLQSYINLPVHLQKCFAYCSIFPQDYEFKMDELALLWVAEGFIQSKGASSLEHLANGYFKDLCVRFFFEQCINVDNEVRYNMPSLYHDVARLVSWDICSHWKSSRSSLYPLFGNSCHLLLLHDSTEPLQLKVSIKNDRLRTFILLEAKSTQLDPELFKQLKNLRVLGLADAGLSVLEESIVELKYLRYLNLSGNRIAILPDSLFNIVSLEIFKLQNCPNLLSLPNEIINLIKLRHLDLDEETNISMPEQFGELACLEHLPVYVVSLPGGAGIGELKNMNSLCGSLCIKNIDLSNPSDARNAKLSSKTRLKKLDLRWKRRISVPQDKKYEETDVFANFQPHFSLNELVIVNFCGLSYPAWLSASSQNYTSVILEGLNYIDHLPCLGELPFLTFFAISDMPSLQAIGPNFYGKCKFPKLKSFDLKDLSKLTEWENDYGTREGDSVMPLLPCLSKFTLDKCPLLTKLPDKLKSLVPVSDVSDCPNLQL